MKPKRYKRVLILWPLILFLSMNALAQSLEKTTPSAGPQTCLQVVQAADIAIAAQKKQVEIRDLRLVQQEQQIQGLNKDLVELKSFTDQWFKSPWLWLAVGVVTGGLIVRKL